jgi:hypothetical protein
MEGQPLVRLISAPAGLGRNEPTLRLHFRICNPLEAHNVSTPAAMSSG